MGTLGIIFRFLILFFPAITSFAQGNQNNKGKPVITGQTPSPLTTQQGTSVTITLANLIVTDPDPTPVYPNGFTITVHSGKDYTISGTTITPDAKFSGNLKVPVSVNDGQNESKKFDLKIDVQKVQPNVTPSQNVTPQITGHVPITINQGQSTTITLSQLTVTDPDDNYPAGFTLTVYSGKDYTFSGTTISPDANFSGNLKVPVSVNDGQNESKKFDLKIDVQKVQPNVTPSQNVAPQITGQVPITINQGQRTTINLNQLTVSDPDDNYPAGFTLTVYSGNHYTFSGATITPDANFSGNLKVPVSVNDGQNESKKFDLKIDVQKVQPNVAPTIVGQRSISITQGTPFTLQLFHLVVDDPDNDFPADFTLKIFPGTNYTIDGNRITPAASFVSGTLSVATRVNDGTDESPRFEVKIQVTPISATPKINGQRELTMIEDSTLTLALTDLIVTDADNQNYPKGFTLKILANSEGVYQSSGNTITPSPDLNGFIEVSVTVSDGRNTSEEFKVAIFVEPVNDAPQITLLDSSPLAYEPGREPAELFSRLALVDVDNEFLSMAEIGFRQPNFSAGNDEILYEFDTTKIRAIKDPSGILFLIGYATVEEYQTALRSMRYNYRISKDQNGQPEGILPGSRMIYTNVNDGQSISLNTERRIDIEARIALDIPTAFTPNGDKANDTWHLEVTNKAGLDQSIIKVYNKRGLLIYESNGFDKEWDGTYNGQLLPVDTYYYTIVIKLPYVKQTYSGVVTVLY